MGKKYLFSPIGNTDPIKYLYDGSMLHICRYYEPDVVYLYLSKEMAENHKKDNRYVETLNLLGDFLNHKFEVHIIENPDMEEVQQYDVFYEEFRKIISEIEEQKEKEDQLLVNMASGIHHKTHHTVEPLPYQDFQLYVLQICDSKSHYLGRGARI